MYDVGKAAVQEATIDLGSAFCGFFRQANRVSTVQAQGGQAILLRRQRGRTFRADGKRIKLPVIGWVRMREAVRFTGPLKRATVCCEAGRLVRVPPGRDDLDVQLVAQPEPAVGIDLGVTTLARLSTGETIEGPKSHKAAPAGGCAGRTRRWRASGAVRAMPRWPRPGWRGCIVAWRRSGAMPRTS